MDESTEAWAKLSELLPATQREQLAEILIRQLGRGYGRIEIECEDHHVKTFREVTVIPARREKKP